MDAGDLPDETVGEDGRIAITSKSARRSTDDDTRASPAHRKWPYQVVMVATS